MDFDANLMNNCPVQIVEPVQRSEIIFNKNNNIINDLTNEAVQYGSQCNDAIIGYLFNEINGSERLDYIYRVAGIALARYNELSPVTRELIVKKSNLIPFSSNQNYERTYFLFLIRFGVILEGQTSDDFVVSDDPKTADSPLWYKQLYFAHLEEQKAYEYILKRMKKEENPNIVVMLMGDLRLLNKRVRNKIFSEFKNDNRATNSADPALDGPTVGEYAEIYSNL